MLNVSGTLDLNGFNQQVAGVTGNGTVTDSGSTAVFALANDFGDTFAGVLTGSLEFAATTFGFLNVDLREYVHRRNYDQFRPAPDRFSGRPGHRAGYGQ